MLKYPLISLMLSLSSLFLISSKSEAIPLDPILNQLIERVLGVNTNSSYPYPVSAGDNPGGYPSSYETVPLEQNPSSYPNYSQPQQSYPQQQYPYPQQPYYPQSSYPQQPYYPQQSYPQQPMNYPSNSSTNSQPFIYSPVFMPPTINNFNNR